MRLLCSNPGEAPKYLDYAAMLAENLVKSGMGLAYVGEVIGVMSQFLAGKELSHPGFNELKAVGSMHERKIIMADIAGGFIALSGGLRILE